MRMTRQQTEEMIRYEDDKILVVHKPPYLAVETKDVRQQDLVSLLCSRRVAKREPAYIAPVHRIDQPVEGLLLLAKTSRAAAALSAQLGTGSFAKEYLAVVQGVTEEKGMLVHKLKKDGRTNTSRVVPQGDSDGKEARLTYERILSRNENSLIRIHLDTGRHHQIRVQFAAIGHPLLGDVKYGGGQYGHPLALCSSRLAFTHPDTGEVMEFQVEPSGSGFDEFREALG